MHCLDVSSCRLVVVWPAEDDHCLTKFTHAHSIYHVQMTNFELGVSECVMLH
eukprot:COSAG02_NODE_13012_length_1460_cov_1.693608_3_plen_51_part_01